MEHQKGASFGQPPALLTLYYAGKAFKVKRSGLSRTLINYGCKMFYSISTRWHVVAQVGEPHVGAGIV
jgi:hypothetical protein